MAITKLPILGQWFTTRNRTIHGNELINYYCEFTTREDSAIAPQQIPAVALYLMPGTRLAGSVALKNQVRGIINTGGFLWAVIDNGFYKGTQSLSSGAITFGSSLGTLTTSTGPVSMCSSGAISSQILITDGSATKKYYNYLTSTFGTVTDAANTPAKQCDYQDGYGAYVDPTTNRFWITDVSDLSNVTGTNFASLTTKGANAVAIRFFKQYMCLWSTEGVETWFNGGTTTITGTPTTFPWQRLADVYMDKGTNAPHSIIQTDTALFWFSANPHGNNVIVRAGGTALLTPEIISTPSITTLLESKRATYNTAGVDAFSDCQGYCFQDQGHEFLVWTFPIANMTLVYDNYTKMWTIWATGTVGSATGGPSTFSRHQSNCYAFMNGFHYAGSYNSGIIYIIDALTHDDYLGQSIDHVVTTSYVSDSQRRISLPRLEIDMAAQNGSGGTITLYTSKDGGNTFVSQGAKNFTYSSSFDNRVFWTLLGIARDWVFRIVCTPGIEYSINSIVVDIEGSDS